MKADHATFARQIEGPNRSKAFALAKLAMEAEILALHTRREKSKVNYDAWKLRCRVEQLPDTIAARGNSCIKLRWPSSRGDWICPTRTFLAQSNFLKKGWGHWKKTIAAWPLLKEDLTIIQDLSFAAGIYRRRILDGRPLPDDFPLKQEIEEWDRRQPEDLGQLLKAMKTLNAHNGKAQ